MQNENFTTVLHYVTKVCREDGVRLFSDMHYKNKRQQAQFAQKILTESKEKNVHHEDCQILEYLAKRFFVIIILKGFQNFSGQQALSNPIQL